MGSKITAVLSLGLFVFSAKVQAEQNFFNVPSSEITEKGQFFFQEQVNFGAGPLLGSNTTFVYGLGNNWEVGLNLFNLELSLFDQNQSDPNLGVPSEVHDPILMVNAQRGLHLSEHFEMGIGTELGRTLSTHSQSSFAGVGYINLAYMEKSLGLRVMAGLFVASLAYRGAGGSVGIWTGGQLPIAWDQRIMIVGDSIFAGNGIGISVMGGAVKLSRSVILSLGFQFPNPGSSPDTGTGGVFEFTAFL